LKNMI